MTDKPSITDILNEAASLIGYGLNEPPKGLAEAIERGDLDPVHFGRVHANGKVVTFYIRIQVGLDWNRSGTLEARIEAPFDPEDGYHPTVKVRVSWAAVATQTPASSIRMAKAYREAAELACAAEDVLTGLRESYSPHVARDLQALGESIEADLKRVLSHE